MSDETIEGRIARYNRRVNSEFARAEKGEVINLTSMMIEGEKIHQDLDRRRRSR